MATSSREETRFCPRLRGARDPCRRRIARGNRLETTILFDLEGEGARAANDAVLASSRRRSGAHVPKGDRNEGERFDGLFDQEVDRSLGSGRRNLLARDREAGRATQLALVDPRGEPRLLDMAHLEREGDPAVEGRLPLH